MALSKKFMVVFLVLSTISLCLAKPRWIWFRDEEKNVGDFNDEVQTIEKKSGNEIKDLGERNYRSKNKMTTKPLCSPSQCPPPGK